LSLGLDMEMVAPLSKPRHLEIGTRWFESVNMSGIWKWLPLCPTATPRSRFDGIVVDGLGGFVSFVVAVLNVVATPLGGGGPTLPLWGRVVT
jgi:hypothetical protein